MRKKILFLSLLGSTILTGSPDCKAQNLSEPLIIREQGSFAAGGTIVPATGEYDPVNFRNPGGQNAYTDHAYVFYQLPPDAKRLPLIFLHGGGQSGKTWESTPDGREGFQTIFLRKGYGVYLVDQPRRGRAGAASFPGEITPLHTEIMLFSLFRIGQWPKLFPGVQFPGDEESLHQMFRQGTPDTGPYDDTVTIEAMSALFDKIGPGILITHSRDGYPDWLTTIKNDRVRAIVSYEPGGSAFVFSEGEVPEPIQTSYGLLTPKEVPSADFKKLTEIPIIIYYGDNIAEQPTPHIGQDQWRGEMQLAKKFAAVANRYGGDVTVVHLPELGIYGNTHFPMSDLNNIEIADLLSAWLEEKELN
ncbi:MAG: alpha/beta fold hydrolase [Bacteroides sp.]|nr:alpha/beta fold hydrolase [Bacteroides sp.]